MELRETESRMVVARSRGVGTRGGVGPRVHASYYKMNLSSGDLMCNMVIIAKNTVSYTPESC